MSSTSLKQKLLLNFFGLFLTVILLEIGLRLAGGLVFFLQERHNHLSFKQNEYRILCLGESTTALGGEDSYPSQLEELLNTPNQPTHYTVINEGIISTTTEYILSHLERNLDQYKPQLVILMMGINDKAYLHHSYKALWWENVKSYLKDFRVYKLINLIAEHISHRMGEINASARSQDHPSKVENNNQQTEDFLKLLIAESIQSYQQHALAKAHYLEIKQTLQAEQENQYAHQSIIQASLACVELSRRYRLKGLLDKARHILENATSLNPNSPDIFAEWGKLSLALNNSTEAIKYFQAALSQDPKNNDVLLGLAHAYHEEHNDYAFLVYSAYLQINPNDYWEYIEFAHWLREAKHYDLAEAYLTHAIELAPYFDQAFLDMGQTLDIQGQYAKEEEFYKNEISLYPKNGRLYQALEEFYQRQGKVDLAKKYYESTAKLQKAEYYPVTFVNYSLILDRILSRKIKVIVMQYPLEDIDVLKNYLGDRNGVIYVENKENFKEALTKENFNYYFKDNFAYNFGHCTRAGNALIAQNLSKVIEE